MRERVVPKLPLQGGIPAPLREPLAPDTIIGTYKITHSLGKGGQARVYRGTCQQTGRNVAIKQTITTDSKATAQLRKEADHLSSLKGVTGVVSLIELDSHERFMALGYVSGPSLARKGYDQNSTWRVLATAACATLRILNDVHENGVIHRDVKPQNILVSPGGPILIDFGMAHTEGTITPSNRCVVGTPTYMAPEQAIDLENVDGRADIYSVATMLYHAAFGTFPFRADRAIELLRMKQHDRPPLHLPFAREGVPEGIRDILAKGLARDPEERFQTAKEFAQALEQA